MKPPRRTRFGGGTPSRNLEVYDVDDKYLPYGMRKHQRKPKKVWPFKRKVAIA